MTNLTLADLVVDCGQDWDFMSPCGSNSRHCLVCSRIVVNVSDLSAMISASADGFCVAVDDSIPLDKNDLHDKWPIHKVGVVYSKLRPGVRGVAYKKPKKPLGDVFND